MKVSLLFPPTWHPSQPYLSLPSLTGFLRQGGISDVSQRDLGIELLDTVLTREYAAEVYRHLIVKQRELERTANGETGPGSREHYAKITDSLDRFSYLVDRIELAKETLRSEEFYDPDAYRASLFMIYKWLEVVS
jgi:anaerobic magnesium-protoporphyrin IX monomethyl ester cyclase